MAPRRRNKLSSDQDPSIDTLFSAIRDPHNPKLCGPCLRGCLVKAIPARAEPAIRNSLAKRHDLWNALLLFVTTKRSNKQMERILTRLSECNCSLTTPFIAECHRIGVQEGAETILRRMPLLNGVDVEEDVDARKARDRTSFIIGVFKALLDGLHETRVTTVAKREATTWPTFPGELLPFGADVFVESMLQWHQILQDNVVFAVCGSVIRICRTMLLPSMVSHSFCARMVDACRSIFDTTLAAITAENGGDMEHAKKERLADVFFAQTDEINQFLEIMKQESDWEAFFFRGNVTKMVQASCLILFMASDPRLPRRPSHPLRLACFAYFAQRLYRLFHMHLPPRPAIPVHPRVLEADTCRFPPDPIARTLPSSTIFYIKAARQNTCCSAVGCNNSLQSAGKDFQRCSRCNVVPYCGRECQIQAWRNEAFPHKRVCPKLRYLVAQGGGWDAFAKHDLTMPYSSVFGPIANWQAANVDDAELQYVTDWSKALETFQTQVPDGTEWTPGFDDYDTVVMQFSGDKRMLYLI